jgi:transcriptional regulator with XRE-family HTH domain
MVKEWRKQRRLSQYRLSKLSGVSQGFINDIERGRRIPSIPTLEKLSKVLKVNIGDLIKDDIDYTEEKSTPII